MTVLRRTARAPGPSRSGAGAEPEADPGPAEEFAGLASALGAPDPGLGGGGVAGASSATARGPTARGARAQELRALLRAARERVRAAAANGAAADAPASALSERLRDQPPPANRVVGIDAWVELSTLARNYGFLGRPRLLARLPKFPAEPTAAQRQAFERFRLLAAIWADEGAPINLPTSAVAEQKALGLHWGEQVTRALPLAHDGAPPGSPAADVAAWVNLEDLLDGPALDALSDPRVLRLPEDEVAAPPPRASVLVDAEEECYMLVESLHRLGVMEAEVSCCVFAPSRKQLAARAACANAGVQRAPERAAEGRLSWVTLGAQLREIDRLVGTSPSRRSFRVGWRLDRVASERVINDDPVGAARIQAFGSGVSASPSDLLLVGDFDGIGGARVALDLLAVAADQVAKWWADRCPRAREAAAGGKLGPEGERAQHVNIWEAAAVLDFLRSHPSENMNKRKMFLLDCQAAMGALTTGQPGRAERTSHTVALHLTKDTLAAPLCGAHVPNYTDIVDIYELRDGAIYPENSIMDTPVAPWCGAHVPSDMNDSIVISEPHNAPLEKAREGEQWQEPDVTGTDIVKNDSEENSTKGHPTSMPLSLAWHQMSLSEDLADAYKLPADIYEAITKGMRRGSGPADFLSQTARTRVPMNSMKFADELHAAIAIATCFRSPLPLAPRRPLAVPRLDLEALSGKEALADAPLVGHPWAGERTESNVDSRWSRDPVARPAKPALRGYAAAKPEDQHRIAEFYGFRDEGFESTMRRLKTDQIRPRLYIGTMADAAYWPLLEALSITHVVNCAVEAQKAPPPYEERGIKYLLLPLHDSVHEAETMLRHKFRGLRRATRFVRDVLK
ncbi:unnamed protein product, partial [Prorocentrum cordatum]